MFSESIFTRKFSKLFCHIYVRYTDWHFRYMSLDLCWFTRSISVEQSAQKLFLLNGIESDNFSFSVLEFWDVRLCRWRFILLCGSETDVRGSPFTPRWVLHLLTLTIIWWWCASLGPCRQEYATHGKHWQHAQWITAVITYPPAETISVNCIRLARGKAKSGYRPFSSKTFKKDWRKAVLVRWYPMSVIRTYHGLSGSCHLFYFFQSGRVRYNKNIDWNGWSSYAWAIIFVVSVSLDAKDRMG